jgi:uncharacterized membrane protein
VTCGVCGKEIPNAAAISAAEVPPALTAAIAREHPEWNALAYICLPDLNHYRTRHVQASLEEEKGELSELERQVVESIHEQDILAENLNEQFDTNLTFGQRLADRVAEFGGSWAFIITFGVVLCLWIVANTVLLIRRPWDPYPFILLNLILSCVAALQAPVIMMSQNRQEAKDRLRAENDYRVNLKAELEIRNLHAKIDLLLTHQWQRLLEIQEIQTQMMAELIGDRADAHKPQLGSNPEDRERARGEA